MRHHLIFFLFFSAFVFILPLSAAPFDFDMAWRGVDRAVADQLPQSAVAELTHIERESVARHEWAQAVRCSAERIRISTELEGKKMEELLPVFSDFAKEAPPPMQPGLQLLLAHFYWSFFQENRWRFDGRTQVAKNDEDTNPANWSLPRILEEIERRFTVVLSYEEQLKLVPIASYGALLVPGRAPDIYRPTLFDFAVNDIIGFYNLDEQITRAENASELDAGGPCLGPVEKFMLYIPENMAEGSSSLRAVKLFQKLLKFHERDKDRTAYADADLSRLQFCHNHSVGEEKTARYTDALDQFMARWRKLDVSARAAALCARLAMQANDPGLGRLIASRAAAAFPHSSGGMDCRNIIAIIEHPSLSFAVEQMWCEPWPEITVRYRNLTDVSFRLVPLSFSEMMAQRNPSDAWGRSLPVLLARKPAKAWTQTLPPPGDYKESTFSFTVPKDLEPGMYALLASADPSFGKAGTPVMMEPVRVSRLALVMSDPQDDEQRGFVLNAKEGTPVADARVHVWKYTQKPNYEEIGTVATKADGSFTYKGQRGNYMFYATDGKQAAHTWNPSWIGGDRFPPDEKIARVFLFTDREIYRPGQAVQFKGVLFDADRANKKFHVIPFRRVTVTFLDTNRKTIDTLMLMSNEFGSFSGTFLAPRGRNTGRMVIQVEKFGSNDIRVEEYKRPKFSVTLDPPPAEAILNAPVLVTGHARTYTDLPVAGAKVSWRVRRTAHFPWWWLGRAPAGAQEIAHGTAVTDDKGDFTVLFPAKPDKSCKEGDEPSFTFDLNADVTDTTGETRSANSACELGYCSWRANFLIGEWLPSDKPVAFTLKVKSLSNTPVATRGQLKIYTVKQPASVRRDPLLLWEERENEGFADGAEKQSDINRWEDDAEAASEPIETDTNGVAKGKIQLKPGIYRLKFETVDNAGKRVTAVKTISLFDPASKIFPLSVPDHFLCESSSVEPGESLRVLWGTGYAAGNGLIRVQQNEKTLLEKRNAADRTQEIFELPVTEAMRGRLTVQSLFLRENRLYTHTETVDVPWSNKRLGIKWEHFISTLEPGKKETWTASVTGPANEPVMAEVAATLYDKSLDALAGFSWQNNFEQYFNLPYRTQGFRLSNERLLMRQRLGNFPLNQESVEWNYRTWKPETVPDWGSGGFYPRRMLLKSFGGARNPRNGFVMERAEETVAEDSVMPMAAAVRVKSCCKRKDKESGADKAADETGQISDVPARKNLQETAFFLPHLLSKAKDGQVTFSFTVPEALTGWHFAAFAHDKELRAGKLEDASIVTRKDLMVQPAPPRFVREGDELSFAVKITNTSGLPQRGLMKLTFLDAVTLENVDKPMANKEIQKPVELSAGESKSVEWRIHVPDGQGFLLYRAIAATDNFSDGEEGYLPVLSRRVAVQETLPLPMRGKGIKKFELASLLASKKSGTLRHQSLTVQMVSQPAWYAVLALPYLMEFPHECCEQTFNRYYANALARYIAESNPKIREIFNQWAKTGDDALFSPLQKNEDLKSIVLDETPWLNNAKNETQARRNVGVLFDAKRLAAEQDACLKKLTDARFEDGTWPWFAGGISSDYITLYIVTGFARLHALTGIDTGMATAALPRLDAWMNEQYQGRVLSKTQDDYTPSSAEALYLYMRTFYLKENPIEKENKTAFDSLVKQAKAHWQPLWRQAQARIALSLHRLGDKNTSDAILRSFTERAAQSEDQGMFWRDTEEPWSCYAAPIETQALMIEAYREITHDDKAVEACQVWLLKQKQTQGWKTTTATADAVYALLLGGKNLLEADALVDVSLGGTPVPKENVEAGTGFYEYRYGPQEIESSMGKVTVRKKDDGVSWGSVYWQYLEDINKAEASTNTPVQIRKRYFVKVNTARGKELIPVKGAVEQGAELVTRIEIHSDRILEFVHLKDERPSCAEPVNVLSGYRWQDGLGYYESTRDTATHFFIDRLPKGNFVFEYSCRLQQRGIFSSGMARLECMYAPEFSSHSESFPILVK